MKAIIYPHPGDEHVLQLADVPTPTPGPGQVLIRVQAAGINRPDIFQREGSYPPPPDASPLLGLEVAGTIIEGDLSGSDFNIGDAVCALAPGGGYAEYCVVPTLHCLPIPKGLSMAEAASLPETYFTVWSNVFQRALLQPGERLLVHAGASGIGSTAIQLAKAMGSTVYTTLGNASKADAVRALGADAVILYKEEDFVERIQALTNGQGVDVVLDMVSGDYLQRNLQCLAEDGRVVIIALLGGSKATINSGLVLRKRLSISGSTLRPRSIIYKAQIAQALRQRVWPLFAQGRLKPVVYQTFPLAQAAQAHRLMQDNQHIGKIVLTI